MLFIKFHSEAEADFQEALEWYAQQRIGLEAEFMLCVDEALTRIQRNPEIYPCEIRNIRKTLVRRFPYIIYYEVEKHDIMILAIFHAKRHPRYWQQRIAIN